jgi:Ca2+-binding RTX toxin-like protein
MGIIFVEGTAITASGALTSVPAQHACIVYQNDSGQEFVIRAGPGPDGTIRVEAGVPIAQSVDSRTYRDPATLQLVTETPEQRGQVELQFVQGQTAEGVYDVMRQLANQIDSARIPYDTQSLSPQNSNTFVAELLRAVGIDFVDVRPTRADFTVLGYYGSAASFAIGRSLLGGDQVDLLFGGSQVDSLLGKGGNDYLAGGAG